VKAPAAPNMPLCIISHVKYLSISCCPVTNSRVLDRSEFSLAPARKQISAIAKHSLGPTTPPSSQTTLFKLRVPVLFSLKQLPIFHTKKHAKLANALWLKFGKIK
jgi:hypothetical protein